jgi:hypothetical protein
MAEFSRDKTWVCFEDNEDGTMTVTLNLPKDDLYDQSAVLAFGIEEIVAMGAAVSQEVRDDIANNLTVIPDSVE